MSRGYKSDAVVGPQSTIVAGQTFGWLRQQLQRSNQQLGADCGVWLGTTKRLVRTMQCFKPPSLTKLLTYSLSLQSYKRQQLTDIYALVSLWKLTYTDMRTTIGMPYLDVIRRLRDASSLPIAAYQVSGEYAMLKAAAQKVQTHRHARTHIRTNNSIHTTQTHAWVQYVPYLL